MILGNSGTEIHPEPSSGRYNDVCVQRVVDIPHSQGPRPLLKVKNLHLPTFPSLASCFHAVQAPCAVAIDVFLFGASLNNGAVAGLTLLDTYFLAPVDSAPYSQIPQQ